MAVRITDLDIRTNPDGTEAFAVDFTISGGLGDDTVLTQQIPISTLLQYMQDNLTFTVNTDTNTQLTEAQVQAFIDSAYINGLIVDADTVGGFTVGINVPSDAVFTDTDTNTQLTSTTILAVLNAATGAIDADLLGNAVGTVVEAVAEFPTSGNEEGDVIFINGLGTNEGVSPEEGVYIWTSGTPKNIANTRAAQVILSVLNDGSNLSEPGTAIEFTDSRVSTQIGLNGRVEVDTSGITTTSDDAKANTDLQNIDDDLTAEEQAVVRTRIGAASSASSGLSENDADARYVRHTASQGLTATQQGNARANIGAGTSDLVIGTSGTTALAGDTDVDNVDINQYDTVTTAADDDFIIIQDTSDSNANKKITKSNFQTGLGVGGGAVEVPGPTDSGTADVPAGGIAVITASEQYYNVSGAARTVGRAEDYTSTDNWTRVGDGTGNSSDLSSLSTNPLNYGTGVARPIGTVVTWEDVNGDSFTGNVDDILRSTTFENISTTGTEANSLFPSILIEEVPISYYNDWTTADADTFPGFLVLQELVERGRNIVVEIDDNATVNGSTDQFRDVTATIIELAVPTVNNSSENIVTGYTVTNDGVAEILTSAAAAWNVLEISDARRVLTHLVQEDDETISVTTDIDVQRQLSVNTISASRTTGDDQFAVLTDEGEFTTTTIPVDGTATLVFGNDNVTINTIFQNLGTGQGQLFCTLVDTSITADTTITESGVGNVYRVIDGGIGGIEVERATLTDGTRFTEATGANLEFTFFTAIQTTADRTTFTDDVQFQGEVFGLNISPLDFPSPVDRVSIPSEMPQSPRDGDLIYTTAAIGDDEAYTQFEASGTPITFTSDDTYNADDNNFGEITRIDFNVDVSQITVPATVVDITGTTVGWTTALGTAANSGSGTPATSDDPGIIIGYNEDGTVEYRFGAPAGTATDERIWIEGDFQNLTDEPIYFLDEAATRRFNLEPNVFYIYDGTSWVQATERDIDLAYYHAHTSITQTPFVQRANSLNSSHTFRGGDTHTGSLNHNIGSYTTPSTGTFTVRLSGYLTQYSGAVRGAYQVRLISVSGSATNDDHIVLGRTSAATVDSAAGIFFDDTTVTIGTDVDASTAYYLQVDATGLVDGQFDSFSFVAHFDHEEGGVVATPEFDTYVQGLVTDTDNYVDGGSVAGTTLTLTRTGTLPDLTITGLPSGGGLSTANLSNGDIPYFDGTDGQSSGIVVNDFGEIRGPITTRPFNENVVTVGGIDYKARLSLTEGASGYSLAIATDTFGAFGVRSIQVEDTIIDSSDSSFSSSSADGPFASGNTIFLSESQRDSISSLGVTDGGFVYFTEEQFRFSSNANHIISIEDSIAPGSVVTNSLFANSLVYQGTDIRDGRLLGATATTFQDPVTSELIDAVRLSESAILHTDDSGTPLVETFNLTYISFVDTSGFDSVTFDAESEADRDSIVDGYNGLEVFTFDGGSIGTPLGVAADDVNPLRFTVSFFNFTAPTDSSGTMTRTTDVAGTTVEGCLNVTGGLSVPGSITAGTVTASNVGSVWKGENASFTIQQSAGTQSNQVPTIAEAISVGGLATNTTPTGGITVGPGTYKIKTQLHATTNSGTEGGNNRAGITVGASVGGTFSYGSNGYFRNQLSTSETAGSVFSDIIQVTSGTQTIELAYNIVTQSILDTITYTVADGDAKLIVERIA